MRSGDDLSGQARAARGRRLESVETILGRPVAELRDRPDFQPSARSIPNEPLRLECRLVRQGPADHTNRIIDLLSRWEKASGP